MQKNVEKEIRAITGPGKLYQVSLQSGELSYIETDKEYFEVSGWDTYCTCCVRGCFMDVSTVEGSKVLDKIRGVFGADAKIIAYSDSWRNADCYGDSYFFKRMGPDANGHVSVQPDDGVNYLVCVPPKRKLDFSGVGGEVTFDGTAIVFPEA